MARAKMGAQRKNTEEAKTFGRNKMKDWNVKDEKQNYDLRGKEM